MAQHHSIPSAQRTLSGISFGRRVMISTMEPAAKARL
jgi:hypothetical protein